MPEYTYLLDTRLTAAQQNALAQIRDAAREAGMTVFLTGGAVRDLTTGSSVRDLDFSVQGDALGLEASFLARGATLWGRHEPSRTLFLWFPGSVRVEVSSTRAESFPKPGQPEYTWTGIVDDLFRRDFTVNAMALSLNEGSYGLLLDPLNGVADTEARQLRLVSNYGFIEDPSRLVRAARLALRLGWSMEERTAVRYQNAKEADSFQAVDAFRRSYEMEEIAAEDDALGTLKAFEAEGWMAQLFPEWTSAHADTAALESLHRNRIQLLMQGIAPDLQAAHLELMTAKMKPATRAALKNAMARPGLRAQWESLPESAKEFSRLLTGKDAATASAAYKLFHAHPAEPVLWLAHTGRGSAEEKFKQLFTVWPEVAKKVPVALMTELRITPELPVYPELLHALFLEQIDDRLQTDEEMRAFLEQYSPPAPPPPVTLKRSRSRKADSKSKRRVAVAEDGEDAPVQDEDADGDEKSATDSPGLDDDAELESRAGDEKDEDEERDEDGEKTVREEAAGKGDPKATARQPGQQKAAPARPGKPASRRVSAEGAVDLAGVDVSLVLKRIAGNAEPEAAVLREPGRSQGTPAVAEIVASAKTTKGVGQTPEKSHSVKAPAAPTPSAKPAPVKPAMLKSTSAKTAPANAAPANAAPVKAAPAKAAAKPVPVKAAPAKAAPVKAAPVKATAVKAAPAKATSTAHAPAKSAAGKPVKTAPGKPAAKGMKTASPQRPAGKSIGKPGARQAPGKKPARPPVSAHPAKKAAAKTLPSRSRPVAAKKSAARPGSTPVKAASKAAAKKPAKPARRR